MTKAITDYSDLLRRMEVPEIDESVLKRAFTHRSLESRGNDLSHNERLEFLGDAVLELIVTEYLFHAFPEKREGELTNYRSSLVCKPQLAVMAKALRLGPFIRMSRGEALSGGREKDYILANAMEAVLGAVYLCCGIEMARGVVDKFLLPDLHEIIKNGRHIDAKSRVQEIIQAVFNLTPTYALLYHEGKDHQKTFRYAVMMGEVELGQGDGGSKKRAQMAAAEDALNRESEWNPPA